MLNNKLLDALETVASAKDDEALTAAVGAYLAGFDIHMFTSILAMAQDDGDDQKTTLGWLTNCDPSWFETYVDENFQAVDFGVRRHVFDKDDRPLLIGDPFSDQHADISAEERGFYREAAGTGLVSGLTLPRWTDAPGGVLATGFSVWTALGRQSFEKMMTEHGREAVLFLLAVEQKLLPPLLRTVAGYDAVTVRERDCLQHTAAGKRADEIADALCLSTATVRLYLSSVRKKLKARTLPEAVAKALTAGLIGP